MHMDLPQLEPLDNMCNLALSLLLSSNLPTNLHKLHFEQLLHYLEPQQLQHHQHTMHIPKYLSNENEYIYQLILLKLNQLKQSLKQEIPEQMRKFMFPREKKFNINRVKNSFKCYHDKTTTVKYVRNLTQIRLSATLKLFI